MNWIEIRRQYENGMPVSEIAKMYNVKPSTVRGRQYRELWQRKQHKGYSTSVYYLSRRQLLNAIEKTLELMAEGRDILEWLRSTYPEKKFGVRFAMRLKQVACRRLERRSLRRKEDLVIDCIAKLDHIYRLSIDAGDLKTALLSLRERSRILDLYSKTDSTDKFDIVKFTDNKIKEFTIENERYDGIETLSDIELMNGGYL